jgi:phosphopantothenoylcysteine decarboxylase/phosphopantothenate--cysteine ligase
MNASEDGPTRSSPRDLPLAGKRVALGVTGSISAFKAADLCSKLCQAGADVEVVMTRAATQFVTPLTFQSLTARDVVVDMFTAREAEAHVEVARRADALVIAPASADCMANLAHGQAPDMVTLTALATMAPILVAPAMDNQMWEHPATQANVETLRTRGVTFIGPMEGRLASGRMGAGRLAETPQVIGALRALLGERSGDLRGRHVVVSAGPTHEPLDPVRFIGNHSTGKMGFAIAEAARDRGARVTLVTGPVALETPWAVERVNVHTVADMLAALERATADADAIIMAAAPADFRPASSEAHKIKKAPGEDGSPSLSPRTRTSSPRSGAAASGSGSPPRPRTSRSTRRQSSSPSALTSSSRTTSRGPAAGSARRPTRSSSSTPTAASRNCR